MVIFIGAYIGDINSKKNQANEDTNTLFDLEELSNYLGMSEEEIKNIMMIEEIMLNQSGHYSGMMFPYFKVDEKYYFYKETIDEWLEEVTTDKKQYDSKSKYAF